MSKSPIDPFTTVTRLCADLAAGRVTAEAVVEQYLSRIAGHDEHLHAFVRVYAEEARQAARAADMARAAGHAVGPLHGVPVALKDIVEMRGRITTGGSKVWEQRVSAFSATLAERMLGAGMIVLGKTHTVEFAMGSFGTNQHMGSPRNPWDTEVHRAPGGSSAGSAAAVAAGMAPWGIGTDTGGSVRIPSAWCGLTGLKTTIGRISTHGVLPLSPTLDTPGPMCRSVEDVALLFALLAGSDEQDPKTALPPPLPGRAEMVAALQKGANGLRLAVMPENERYAVDQEVLAAFDASLSQLEALGAVISMVDLPASFDDMGAMTGDIIGAEGYFQVGELVDDPQLPLDEDVRPRILIGKDMTAQRYLQRRAQQADLKQAFDSVLAGCDALLTPTVAIPAPALTSIDQSGTAARFTRPFNFIEYCALALPNGCTREGLPISLQIACGSNHEMMALRIGAAYQGATDWHRRWPEGSGGTCDERQ